MTGSASQFPPSPRPVDPAHIQLDAFRQIFFWPLTLEAGSFEKMEQGARENSGKDFLQRFSAALTGQPKGARAEPAQKEIPSLEPVWEEVEDPYGYLTSDIHKSAKDAEGSPFAYQELVYFHDFVTRFLFPGKQQQAESRNFRLFRETRIRQVRLTVRHSRPYGERQAEAEARGVDVKETAPFDHVTHDLAVDRCHLYATRHGVIILAIETSLPGNLSLAASMTVTDAFRRCYPPFFSNETGAWEATAEYPVSVAWGFDKAGEAQEGTAPEPVFTEAFAGPDAPQAIEHAREKREPRLAPWWVALMPDCLRIAGDGREKQADGFNFRHIIDERMPSMTFLSLVKHENAGYGNALEMVSRGAWARLCFVDQPGNGLPYCSSFLPDFDRQHAYDRFRGWGTRYLISPYSFVMATSSHDFPRYILVNHFRRMYFHMMLLAHLEMTSYIVFSSRISEAISAAAAKGGFKDQTFRKQILHIEEDFMEFVHLFRFTGLSNQVQAKELYEKMRENMRLRELFDDVKEELKTASSYIFAKMQQEVVEEQQVQTRAQQAQAREQHAQTEATQRLNSILTVVAVISLCFAALSMNLFLDGGEGAASFSFGRFFKDLFPLGLSLSVFSFGALLLTRFTLTPEHRQQQSSRQLIRLLGWAAGLGIAACVAGLVIEPSLAANWLALLTGARP